MFHSFDGFEIVTVKIYRDLQDSKPLMLNALVHFSWINSFSFFKMETSANPEQLLILTSFTASKGEKSLIEASYGV
jgi:hypothetical protein